MVDLRTIKDGKPIDDPLLVYIDGCPTKVSWTERWLLVELKRQRTENWRLRRRINELQEVTDGTV